MASRSKGREGRTARSKGGGGVPRVAAASEVAPFDRFAAAEGPKVERALRAILPDPRRAPRAVHRAMKYMVVPGGKRLRPLMVLMAHRTCAGRHRRVYEAAASMELIHTFSLIHDDLPCMDDDDYRRGRPSCHKAFGEATAVLAGDALLVLAFQILGRIASDGLAARAVRTVSESIGTFGVIGGQSLDLDSEGKAVSRGILATIHRRKTAALFVGCLLLGAILARGSEREQRALAKFGAVFGHAFQVADDLLNVEGGFRELGRPRGSDSAHRKATYPRIVGARRTRGLLGRLVRDAVRAASVFGDMEPVYRGLALKAARRVPSWSREMEEGMF